MRLSDQTLFYGDCPSTAPLLYNTVGEDRRFAGVNGLWHTAVSALELTALELFVLAVPTLALGWCLQVVSTTTQSWGFRLLGRWTWLWVLPGVVIHELSHAALCLVFFHRIRSIRFAAPSSAGGRMGYVLHTYNSRSTYQRVGRFFIGAAPLLAGGMVIYAAALWLVPAITPHHLPFPVVSSNGLTAVGDYFGQLLDRLLSPSEFVRWEFYLFVYILGTVGGSLSLSAADLRGMGFGFLIVAGLVLLFNLLLCHLYPLPRLFTLLHAVTAAHRFTFVLAMMTCVLMLNSILLVLLYALAWLKRLR